MAGPPQASSTDPTVQDLIRQAAQKHGVPPELALAVGEQESGFNPTVTGPKLSSGESAVGTFQILPSTAKTLGIDPSDPHQNIEGGVRYLRQLMDQHQGDLPKVLAAYGGVRTDTKYVPGVLARVQKYSQGTPSEVVPVKQLGQTGEDAPGTPPPAPPERWSSWAARQGKEMLQQFDPRHPEGRRNLGGAMGAVIGGTLAAPTAVASGPIGPGTGAVMGAMAGGALVSGGEAAIRYVTGQAPLGGDVGTPPPKSLGQVAQAGLAGGTEQGLYEMGGHVLMWPVKAVGQRAIGTRVGRYAAEGLSTAKQATLSRLQGALDTAQANLRGTRRAVTQLTAGQVASTRRLVSGAAQEARAGVQAATVKGEAQVAGAKGMAATGVSQAEQTAAAGEVGARAPYEQLVGGPPPSAAQAGRQANQVIQEGGPSVARNLAGQEVEKAAASGPAVDIAPLKAEAQRILEQEIKPPAEAFPRHTPEQLSNEAISEQTGLSPERLAEMRGAPPTTGGGKGPPRTPEQVAKLQQTQAENVVRMQAAVVSAQGEGEKDVLKHPALGVINRILNAEDTVSFADAHKFKRELDEAVGTAWDRSVKSRVTNITKHLRTQLRGALSVHAPYNRATAAYQQIAPLYTQGVAPKLRRLAIEEPESIVRMLNPGQPTKAKMLVDLLTQQAEAGGGGVEGQQALEAVQAAWVHQKLIQGGIEKLGDRLDKLPPEFRKAFLSDPKASQVLDHLKLIDTAYKTAVQQGERGVEAATVAGKGGMSAVGELAAQRTGAAREASQQGVEAARASREGVLAQTRQEGARAIEQAAERVPLAKRALQQGKAGAKTQEEALALSSLAPKKGATEVADVLRAMLLGPRSIWGGISIARLLHGPTATDLIRWSAYSPSGTRALVKAITSDRPAEALANLARSSGILGEVTNQAEGRPPSPSRSQQPSNPVGAPPPRPGQVAQSASPPR